MSWANAFNDLRVLATAVNLADFRAIATDALLSMPVPPMTKACAGVICCLTTELSGLAWHPFRAGEHAIHCEHGAATLFTGPLQRVFRQHLASHAMV